LNKKFVIDPTLSPNHVCFSTS